MEDGFGDGEDRREDEVDGRCRGGERPEGKVVLYGEHSGPVTVVDCTSCRRLLWEVRVDAVCALYRRCVGEVNGGCLASC